MRKVFIFLLLLGFLEVMSKVLISRYVRVFEDSDGVVDFFFFCSRGLYLCSCEVVLGRGDVRCFFILGLGGFSFCRYCF